MEELSHWSLLALSDEGAIVWHILTAFYVFFLFDGSVLLHAGDCHLEKLVLTLGFEDLLLQEVPLLLHVVASVFPFSDFFSELIFLLLLSDLVISNGPNCFLQVYDLLVFEVVVGVLLLQSHDELSQFLFLSFDVQVVALEIFVLLLGKHTVELFVKSVDDIVKVSLDIFVLGSVRIANANATEVTIDLAGGVF